MQRAEIVYAKAWRSRVRREFRLEALLWTINRRAPDGWPNFALSVGGCVPAFGAWNGMTAN